MAHAFFLLACFNAALAYPTTTQPPSILLPPPHIFLRGAFDNLTDSRDITFDPVNPHQRDRHAWVLFVAKLLAGVFGLTALIIMVFWLWRRKVRSRRRRLGEMMGLGIKRDAVLVLEWRKSGKVVARSERRGSGRWKSDGEESSEEDVERGGDRVEYIRTRDGEREI
jgi:hypothetical protein